MNKYITSACLLFSSLAFSQQWPEAVNLLRDQLFSQNVDGKISPDYERLFSSEKRIYQEEAVGKKLLNIVMPKPHDTVLGAYSNAKAIKRSKVFFEENRRAFMEMKYQSRVPPSAVAAILFVETLYGRLKLRQFPTLDTLVSLAALSQESFRSKLTPSIFEQAQRYAPSDKWKRIKAWEERLKDIGTFWQNELRQFLLFATLSGWSPEKVSAVKGSWVGAFGYNQMLPSTAMVIARSSGAFDPWDWGDVIRATGAELSSDGWLEDAKNAIFKYNQARWYVEAVWDLHQKLEQSDFENAGKKQEQEDQSVASDTMLKSTIDPQELRSGFYEHDL